MSIIKLSEPWCFNAMSLEQSEVRELQKHFVNEDNHQCDWSNTDYCGITSDGLSEYFSSPEFFDEDDDNNKTTVYTIKQLRDIIAEHLAKQPVEKLEDGVVYSVKDTHCPEESWLAVNKVAYVNIHQEYLDTAENGDDVDWQEQLEEGDRWEFTKATLEQIAHYEACVKAGKYVEPENVTNFVVGKWYKWFQKDHGREQKGKCATLYDSHFEMKPWICHGSEYVESGMFNLRDAESIELIEDLSEIQDLLPEGHEDKWVKTAPNSERYLETMKFFEQLREPERSEAIANYDEDYGSGTKVPKDLAEAINYGFEWSSTKQEHEYWMVIKDEIVSGIYFQEELLVFGKYKVGDIVVLQVCTDRYPMFKVSKDSTPDKMIDETGAHSTNPGSFRPATPEEVEAYNQGIRNVADIKPKDCKVVPEYVECVNSKTHHYKEGKIYTWPDTITEECKPNKPGILKGSVWEFKPSTKEAYDEQQEKLKMEELLNEAKRRYPTGTKVRAVLDGPELTTEIFTLTDSHYWASGSKVPACYTEEGHPVCLHLSGKWAEIVKEEPKPTEIKPAKGMHVRCLKENSWSDGKTKIGQIFVIEDVDWSGDMWVNNNSFAKERLGRGEFELLPNYKEEPWIAQVGDWVYTLPDSSGWGMSVKDEEKIFKVKEITNNWCEETRVVLDGSSNPTKKSSTIDPITLPNLVRKATQEEIDSVTKPLESRWPVTENVAWTEWTADNWYVEVSSQEEADAVIDAAAKMYDKKAYNSYVHGVAWKYVTLNDNKEFSLLPFMEELKERKPRPITDFIQPEKPTLLETVKKTFFDKPTQQATPDDSYIFAGEVTEEEFNEIKRLCKPQQDELVIYKPKQTRLVEPGAVSASASTTNLIIKSNSKYL